MPATPCFTLLPSPLGLLALTSDGEAITGLYTPEHRHYAAVQQSRQDTAPFREATRQLEAYFQGEGRSFDLPLRPSGTAFQHRVWQALQNIPHGQTRSYGQLAAAIQNPTASRAVGLANGQNPICILIPCHRVIGANGRLTGYAGGLEAKRWLLSHEGVGGFLL